MLIGATYSHRGIQRLQLNPVESFKRALELDFDILRLGVYWDESQPTSSTFDFSAIGRLLDQCDQYNQKVVLTVGMKAPRWPEYYLPQWLKVDAVNQAKDPVLQFIEKVVRHLGRYECITSWQVENEPLDGSGPNKWRIPLDILQEEVKLVRQLDSRPIHINLWGDNIIQGTEFAVAAGLADTVGIDIYYKQPAKDNTYHGPNFNLLQYKWWRWRQVRSGIAKPLWITELQAEPWEHDNTLKFSANPPSISPQLMIANVDRAARLNPEVILLWGLEYWLWAQQQGRPQLLQAAQYIIDRQH